MGEEKKVNQMKARASHLPPPEILFDHLSRIDTMKNTLAPAAMEVISELNNSKS